MAKPMTTPQSFWGARAAATALTLSGLFGCSSETTVIQSTCGPGTELVDGACVASTADGSTADTDAVPVDGAVADSTSDDSAGDSAETEAPDSVVASDGAIDSGPGGDPCPTSATAIDCSGECGKTISSECSNLSCFEPSIMTEYPHYVITDLAKLPMVIRTPGHPGKDPKCQPRCGTGNTVYGIGVKLNIPGVPADGIRVRVAAPWQIYKYDPYHPHCMAIGLPDFAKGNCFFDPLSKGRYDFLITTTDPSAPARNITIEHVAPGGARCDGL